MLEGGKRQTRVHVVATNRQTSRRTQHEREPVEVQQQSLTYFTATQPNRCETKKSLLWGLKEADNRTETPAANH